MINSKSFIGIWLTIVCLAQNVRSASDSLAHVPTSNQSIGRVILIESGIHAAGLISVGSVWYSRFDLSQWHWFNDNREWYQMDKLGHAFATYQGAYVSHNIHRHYGFTEQQSVLWSSTAAFIAISSVEIFDGFATEWGASVGDIIANALGVGLFASQQLAWNRQIVRLKFSYHPTSLPQYRPELLGNSFGERLLKDYNAQQYWLSVNVKEIVACDFIPSWLNVAVGMGANNMLSANTSQTVLEGVHPYRRFFFGPDIDLSKIKTRHRFVKGALEVLNMIKIPLPVIEFSNGKAQFIPLF